MPIGHLLSRTRTIMSSVLARCALLVAVSAIIVAATITVLLFSVLTDVAEDGVAEIGRDATRSVATQSGGAMRFGKTEAVEALIGDMMDVAGGKAVGGLAMGADGAEIATRGEADSLAALSVLAEEALRTGAAAVSADGLSFAYPVTFGSNAPEIIGALAMAWSSDPVMADVTLRKKWALAQTGGMLALVIALGVLLLRGTVTRPLARVGTAMGDVAQGVYGGSVPGLRRSDEIGEIARDLDRCRTALAAAADEARANTFRSTGFEGSSAAMMMTDLDGKVTFANTAFVGLLSALGKEADRLAGSDARELHPKLDGLARLLSATDALPHSDEIRIGSSYLGLEINAVLGAGGETIGAVVEWKDVTAERMNRAILAAMDKNQSRAEFALDGRLTSANDNFCALLGRSAAELGDLKLADLVRPVTTGVVTSDGLPKDPIFGRLRLTRGGMGDATLDGGLLPVHDRNGKPIRFVLIGTDVTQSVAQLSEAETTRLCMENDQKHVVDSLRMGLSRLSEGDLTYTLSEPFAAEYEGLRADFNTAAEGLHAAISDVLAMSITMRGEVREIVGAADNMSRRTEHQAATLEETAAALAEITAAVGSAAEGARLADTVVSEARANAENSGVIVQDAVKAMSEISASSDRISKIIGVIDDIAFQTNLLALNAGVEAARAGDAGRGFAVVASEVRALAQRSSEAAREIGALITASGKSVQNGVALVGQTGEALRRISGSVSGISEHVSEISGSAQEQSKGLIEINSSMAQLDQVTQQNAAMFEETTAASHALARQSEDLTERMSKFRLRVSAVAAPSRKTDVQSPRATIAGPRTVPTDPPLLGAAKVTSRQPRSTGALALAAEPSDADDWSDF